jgi:cobyric acid synthase
LPPGRYSFVLKNLSEEDVSLLIFRLPDGKAFQDLADLQSEPGVTGQIV